MPVTNYTEEFVDDVLKVAIANLGGVLPLRGTTENWDDYSFRCYKLLASLLTAGSGSTITILNNAVTTAKIADGAVTTIKVVDGAITSAKIADGTITSADLSNDAVTSAKIADGNITTAKIADGAVTTIKVVDGAITSAKIADGTITSSDLANDAVTSAKIADGAIATAKIADGAVTTGKIQDGTITLADLSTSLADLINSGGSGGGGSVIPVQADPNAVFAGPATGSAAAAPSFRLLTLADIPAVNKNPGFLANIPGTGNPAATVIQVIGNTITADQVNGYSTSAGTFTIPAGLGGVWMLGGSLSLSSGFCTLGVTINGATFGFPEQVIDYNQVLVSGMRPYVLTAGNVIRWHSYSADGAVIANGSSLYAFLLFPM